MSGLAFTRTTPVFGPTRPSRLTLMGIRCAEGDGGDGGDGSGAGGSTYVPPATQADLDRIITDRVARVEQKYAAFSGIDLADLTTKAAELETLRANQGNDLNEVNGKLSAAETRATTAEGTISTQTATIAALEAKVLRYDVAAENSIPLAHAARLIGSTKEELDADAKTYKKSLRTSGYDPGQGQGEGGAASASDEGVSEAEKRFGKQN